jgi:DNA helicase-4
LDRESNSVPLSPKEVEMVLSRDDYMSSFTDLITCFLKHFKGNGLSVEDVRKQASAREIYTPRLEAFLNLFTPIFKEYQLGLQQNNVIDFDDMVIEAADLVVGGQYSSPYTNILVDEFQDISQGRAKLISALANQKKNTQFILCGR